MNNDDRAGLLDAAETDILKGDIAAGYLHAGKDDKAFELASEAARRSGEDAPLAAWVAGIVAWKYGSYDQAAGFF